MKSVSAALALVLALGMNSGVVEAVQDALHLVLEGSTDHADGEEPCPEHGCTPTSHHCGCCTALVVVPAWFTVRVASAPALVRRWPAAVIADGPQGVQRRLARPPAA